MALWYFVDSGQNRQGPVEANALVEAYRLGQVGEASLVWREGLPEWLPLQRFSDELGLATVVPIATPVPPAAPGELQVPAKKNTGCLIAAAIIVGGGLFLVFALAIVAAIALPAYQDYIARSQTTTALADIRPLVVEVESFYQNTGRCPRDADEIGIESIISGTQGRSTTVAVGEDYNGSCAIEGEIVGGNPAVNGQTIRLVREEDGTWSCLSSVAQAKHLPSGCTPD